MNETIEKLKQETIQTIEEKKKVDLEGIEIVQKINKLEEDMARIKLDVVEEVVLNPEYSNQTKRDNAINKLLDADVNYLKLKEDKVIKEVDKEKNMVERMYLSSIITLNTSYIGSSN